MSTVEHVAAHSESALRARACVVVRGAREGTRAEATAIVARLAPADVLWVGPASGEVAPRRAASLLGRTFDAVVLDLHDGLDPDVLGQVHGFVRGGGALVLRMPRDLPAGPEHLAAYPYKRADVGTRTWQRFERVLAAHGVSASRAHEAIDPPPRVASGNAEQAALVAALAASMRAPEPRCAVVIADRGRGKSAALGLALRALDRGTRVAVVAEHAASLVEVVRFAAPRALTPCTPEEALAQDVDVLVIDEAAQLSVPLLRRLAARHARAHLVLATTVRGYEGTGRGFVLRFLAWLEDAHAERRSRAAPPSAEPGRAVRRFTLAAPIRWAEGDALERLVFDALLLDAEPAEVLPDARARDGAREWAPPEVLARDALAADERDLAALFGLLVHAHYRTTPGDLQRLLDAPNMAVHAQRDRRGAIVAACLVAREGGLDAAACDDVLHGRGRIRAHALPDALVAHLGHAEAGALTMVRSVRIAVHPALRRAGLARRLVAHVHATYDVDLFGTLFGATPELVAFRRDVGYTLVRVSASRGVRTGEPSVVMLHPVSARAHALTATLRAELARDLPPQLALGADEALAPDIVAALTADLPAPAPLDDATAEALVGAYAHGPRTLESVVAALAHVIARRGARLEAMSEDLRALLVARVVARRTWAEAARAAGFDDVRSAMRRARVAARALLAPVG